MATEALKTTPITNADATPVVFNDSGVAGGIVRQAVGTLEHAGGDLGSTYRMVRVPSNATGIAVVLSADDAGATGLIDIGLYRTAGDGGAVVDADFFASAYDVKTAAIAQVEVQHESAVYGLEDIEKPLWEALGLSADPGVLYDIVITSTEALGTASTLSIRATWTI